jgi:hypothetical protein
VKIEREFVEREPNHVSLTDNLLEILKRPLPKPEDQEELEAIKKRREKMLEGLGLLMSKVLSNRQFDVMARKLIFCLERWDIAQQLGTTTNNINRQITKATNKLIRYMEQIRDPAELTEKEIMEVKEKFKYRHGKEAIDKIAKARLGKKHTLETKNKISAAKRKKRRK